MPNFAVYDTTTGRVICAGQRTPDQPVQGDAFASTAEILLVDPVPEAYRAHYVASGALVLRPATPTTISKTSILADAVDTATIGGVPAGARADIVADGAFLQTVQVADGTLALSIGRKATITVSISCFPYLDTAYTLLAA